MQDFKKEKKNSNTFILVQWRLVMLSLTYDFLCFVTFLQVSLLNAKRVSAAFNKALEDFMLKRCVV